MIRILFSIGLLQILVTLVYLGRAKILSLILGPSGYGIVATIDQVVLSAVQLAGLGLPFAAMKFLSRSHSIGKDRFHAGYSSFLIGMVALSLIATVVVLLLLVWNPGLFGEDLTPYRGELMIAVLSVPAVMLNIFFVHTLAAAQESTLSAGLNFAVVLALAVAAILGVWLGSIRVLYIATVCTGVATTITTLGLLKWRLDLRIFHKDAGILKELRRQPEIISVAIMLYAALSAYSIVMLVTRFFVFSDLGDVDAGFLQALFGISVTIGAVLGPMNSLYLSPLVNRDISVEEKLKAADEFGKRIVVLLAILVVPVLLFPRLVLTVLYSSEFIPAAAPLFLFILWQVCYQLVNVYQQLLIGLDDVRFFALTATVGFAAAAVACRPLIDAFGLAGAAVALGSATVLIGVVCVLRLRSRFNHSMSGELQILLLFTFVCIVSAGRFATIPEWSAQGLGFRFVFAVVFGVVLWKLMGSDLRRFFYNLSRGRLPRREDGHE